MNIREFGLSLQMTEKEDWEPAATIGTFLRRESRGRTHAVVFSTTL
jgi:hypothetical protein